MKLSQIQIEAEDLIESIFAALQYISYYHPPDFIQALVGAYEREVSPAAKSAMKQILINSRMCALGKRPICQDTGIVTIFLEVGMQVCFNTQLGLESLVNEGVRRAYLHPQNVLRASIVKDPAGKRINTKDNTPAVIHTRLVPGDQVDIYIAAKGGGSENKSKFAMLNPSDSILDWVLETVPKMGAGWCPPGMLGVGIGGTSEKAMLLAKRSLMEPIDIHDLIQKGPSTDLEALRLQIFEAVNGLGIGAQGLGGLTTVLDVKISDYPTHAASKPVAIIPNCAATRHAHLSLTGRGPVYLDPPRIDQWPEIAADTADQAKAVDIDKLTKADLKDFKPGDTLLLSGTLVTGRDAAHKRLVELIEQGKPLPEGLDLNNKLIYYVGPVDPVGDEVVGPAGPTTATRMDKFTPTLLEHTGMLGMIGKAERGEIAVAAIREHACIYLIAVGGAAYLVSKAIRASRVIAFPELGMEAIHEFVVKDMPVTVAVDVSGESVHASAPVVWREKIKALNS